MVIDTKVRQDKIPIQMAGSYLQVFIRPLGDLSGIAIYAKTA